MAADFIQMDLLAWCGLHPEQQDPEHTPFDKLITCAEPSTFSRDEQKVLASGLHLVRYTRDEKKIELSEADPENGWLALEPFPTFAAAERKLKELKKAGNIETDIDGNIIMTGWNTPGGLSAAGFEFYRGYGFHSYDTSFCIKVGSRNWSNLAKYNTREELLQAWDKLMNEDPKALEG